MEKKTEKTYPLLTTMCNLSAYATYKVMSGNDIPLTCFSNGDIASIDLADDCIVELTFRSVHTAYKNNTEIHYDIAGIKPITIKDIISKSDDVELPRGIIFLGHTKVYATLDQFINMVISERSLIELVYCGISKTKSNEIFFNKIYIKDGISRISNVIDVAVGINIYSADGDILVSTPLISD